MSDIGEYYLPAETIVEPPTLVEKETDSLPELIANTPLENTSLIYSIPVMGEWNNGNLQRTLRSFFSQRPKDNEAFEVEFIANIGRHIEALVPYSDNPKRDEEGNYILDGDPKIPKQKKALDLLTETEHSVNFLKQIVEIQRLQRIALHHPDDTELKTQIDSLINTQTDPLLNDLLKRACAKATEVSIAVMDISRTPLYHSKYESIDMSSLRTIGADIATARFADKPSCVLSLFDADTVPQDNHVIRDIQKTFAKYPDMKYLFLGLSNMPAGVSKNFIGDAPRAQLEQTSGYNTSVTNGSPQILFRLTAYEKLKEIGAFSEDGFSGSEDFDTSMRLIYHFGNLEDGLLLESSAELFAPSVMTADRIDGSFDSATRFESYTENGTQHLEVDLGSIFVYKSLFDNLIQNEPSERRTKILKTLEDSRSHFQKKQEVQRRFNRLVLNTFIEAKQENLISLGEDGNLTVQEKALLERTGGDALLHYVRSNAELVKDILESPEDIEVMNYFLGKRSDLPVEKMNHFQKAIREYVGEIQDIDKLVESGLITKARQSDKHFGHTAQDLREDTSQISIMHASVVEMLALGNTYNTFFLTQELKKEHNGYSWPEKPDEQKLPLYFGEQSERVQELLDKLTVAGQETPQVPEELRKPKAFTKLNIPHSSILDPVSAIQTRSFPIFELFKHFRKK